jgi:hypothetical protein
MGVLFDRNTLLVPADRFCFFDQCRYHPGESASFLRKLVGRLMILIEAHIQFSVFLPAILFVSYDALEGAK